jgi:hypothetical protein
MMRRPAIQLLLLILVLMLSTAACRRGERAREDRPGLRPQPTAEAMQPVPPADERSPEGEAEEEAPTAEQPAPGLEPDTAVVQVEMLQEQGGRVSWSSVHDLIALDMESPSGFFDVYTMRPDGSELACLTCERQAGLPAEGQIGQPGWHPSGEFLVIQAQNPELEGIRRLPFGLDRTILGPGAGINNNLWILTADGSQAWQLTDVESLKGVLHPHFSPDGNRLLWGQVIGEQLDRIGHWAIMLADFSFEGGTPSLSNIQQMQPGGLQLYEVHGFSPDGRLILYSGIPQGGYYYDMEVYLMELESQQVTRLTDNDEWDEHAHFTPDGSRIVWTSSAGIPQRKGRTRPFLDYWIMNLDGSGKQRLTYFNDPESPEYIPGGVGPADFDWGPDGQTIAAYIVRGRGAQEASNHTLLIQLDLPSSTP